MYEQSYDRTKRARSPKDAIGNLMQAYEERIQELHKIVLEMDRLGFQQPWIKVIKPREETSGCVVAELTLRARLEVR